MALSHHDEFIFMLEARITNLETQLVRLATSVQDMAVAIQESGYVMQQVAKLLRERDLTPPRFSGCEETRRHKLEE